MRREAAKPTKESYAFNHIPKVGGTTIYRVLERLIGPALSPPISLSDDVQYNATAEDYERFLIIIGHFGVAANDVLAPNRRWMTMLRDPIDRVLSNYYFWRGLAPASPDLPHVYAAQTLPIEEYVRSQDFMVVQGRDNVQTWFLADDFRRKFRKVPESDAFDIAKEHLAKRFAFVGIFEHYSESVTRLCRVLDMPSPDFPIPVENRTGVRKQASEIDPAVIEAFREVNTMDQALYEFAKERFEEESARQNTASPMRIEPGTLAP
jgi:hypothetical protein